MSDRFHHLELLANYASPIDSIIKLLKSHSWDFDGNGYIFTKSHLQKVLKRFNDGELNARDIETWSNLIESREDIEFEKKYAVKLQNAIYRLANPTLEGVVTESFFHEVSQWKSQEN